MTNLLIDLLAPKSFDDLFYLPKKTICAFKNMDHNDTIQNMIFYGPAGLGKTSAANIFFAKRNGDRFSGASITQKPSFLSDIKTQCSIVGYTKLKRLIIIDEVDALTQPVQTQMLKVIDDSSTVVDMRFIFTTNHIDKLIPPLKSRCKPFDFEPQLSDYDEIKEKLVLFYMNKVNLDEATIRTCVKSCFPDLRGLTNTLDFELKSLPAAA